MVPAVLLTVMFVGATTEDDHDQLAPTVWLLAVCVPSVGVEYVMSYVDGVVTAAVGAPT
jgi:hypothetical protein